MEIINNKNIIDSHLNEIRFVNDFNNTYYPGEGYNFEKFQSISSILSKVLPCFVILFLSFSKLILLFYYYYH